MKDNIHPKLAKLEKNFKKDGFINGNLCVVDFLFYEVLLWCRNVDANIFDAYPNIKAFLTKFESLSGVAELFNSEACKSLLFYPPSYVAEAFKNTL